MDQVLKWYLSSTSNCIKAKNCLLALNYKQNIIQKCQDDNFYNYIVT